MPSLKEAVAALTVQKGPICGVAALRATLPKDVLADFDELMAGPTYGTVLVKALGDMGYPVRADALSRHRRRLCLCPA